MNTQRNGHTRQEQLTRAIVSSILAGTIIAAPTLMHTASAQTYTDYKAQLAATIAANLANDAVAGYHITTAGEIKVSDAALTLPKNTTVQGSIYGGNVVENSSSASGYKGNITGTATLAISGNVTGAVYGGGYASGSTSDPSAPRDNTQAKVNNAVIDINDGADVKAVFGGGKESYVTTGTGQGYDSLAVDTTGDATVTKTTINVTGGKVGSIAGGNDTQGTRSLGGNVNYKSDTAVEINVSGGEVGDIRAGGGTLAADGIAASDAHVSTATINLSGGKVTGALQGIGADEGSTLNISGNYATDGSHLHGIWGFKTVSIKKGATVTIDPSASTSNREVDDKLYSGMGRPDNSGTECSNGNWYITSEDGSTLTLHKPLFAFNQGTINLMGQTNVSVTTNTLHQTAAVKADEGEIHLGAASLTAVPDSGGQVGTADWADSLVADNTDSATSTNGGKITAGGSGKALVIDGNILANGNGSQIDLNFGKDSSLKNSHITAQDGGMINIAVKEGFELDLTDKKDRQVNSFWVNDAKSAINLTEGTILTSAGALQSGGGKININGATLKLMRGDTFTDAVKNYPADKQKYVVLNNGILQAPSWVLFEKGLGTEGKPDGTVTDPQAVRADTAASVKFNAGTVVLDDTVYNTLYLQNANAIIKAADGGTTNVTYTGSAPVVDPGGTPHTSDQLADIKNDGIFAPVDAGKPAVAISDGGDSAVAKFNAKNLNLTAPSAGETNRITVTGKTLTLGGPSDGELLTVGGKTPTQAVPMAITGNGSLVLGITAAANTLAADVTLGAENSPADAASLTLASGTQSVSKITANQGTKVLVAKNASLKTNALALKSGSMLQVNGTLTDSMISDAHGATVNIGSVASDAAGTVSLTKDSQLTGSTIFLDPAWKNNAAIEDASKLAYEGTTVDYTLVVGQNSVASLGTADNAAAQKAFADTKLNWNENSITAALYLAKPVSLVNTGALYVDGSRATIGTTATNVAAFAAKSLLMFDGAALNGNAAITATSGNGTLLVDKTAKLYIANAQNGATYKVADGFTTTTAADGWYTTADNIVLNKLFTAQVSNGLVTATETKKSADILPNAVLNNIVDAMTINAASTNGGIKYLSNALEGIYTDAASTQLINTAAQPAEVAGATASALSATMDFADTAQQHFSYGNDADRTHEANTWVKYMHAKNKVDGLQLAGLNANYSSNYNGFVVGYDMATKGNFASGVAFSHGEGSTGASLEHNDYSLWGGSYYGNLRNGRSNLLFDAGYSETRHDVSGAVDTSPRTRIFTAGVNEEYRYHKQGMDIVPHIGLRYLRLDTPNYTGRIDGSLAFHYDPETKNLCTLPVGVGFMSSHTRKDGWNVKFNGDLSYVNVLNSPANQMNVMLPGVTAVDSVSYDTMDKGFFLGHIGLEAAKKDVSYGIGYSYHKGSSSESNHLMANFSLHF